MSKAELEDFKVLTHETKKIQNVIKLLLNILTSCKAQLQNM